MKKKIIKKEKPTQERPDLFGWVCAFLIICFLVFVGWVLNDVFDGLPPDINKIQIRAEYIPPQERQTPLTERELQSLFPTYKEDWKFIQSLTGISGVKLPRIYYQNENSYQDLTTNGYFDTDKNLIAIGREIFATSTEAYARYVLLHEMSHAANVHSGASDMFNDDHCYMAKIEVFLKIGKQIGNEQLGKDEQKKYSDYCKETKDGSVLRIRIGS